MFPTKKAYQLLYWFMIGVFIILFAYLLVKFFPFYGTIIAFIWHLFLPFTIAAFIAYLLYPIIKKLHEHHIHKTYAILLIYLLFLGGIAYLIYLVYPAFMHQLRDLNEYIPQFIKLYEDIIYQIYESTSFLPEAVHNQIDQLIMRIELYLENIVGKLMGGFTKIFDLIILITVIPVLVFYLLKDYQKIKQYFKSLIPKKYHEKTRILIHAIDEKLGHYIRGQLIVSAFVSVTSFIVFHLLGLDYALILAMIMGITNIIPYFGPIIGAIPTIAIAITISTKMVIITVIAIFGIQLIESNFLSPYIVGKSINIHPIAIIFALLLGGQVAGVLGMILAVPLLTILKEITSYFLSFRTDH